MTIKNIFVRFKWRISLTLILVVLESLLEILYPLLIGIAINGLLDEKYDGVIYLASLGVLSLIIGSARRFYDTRIYSKVYRKIAAEMVEREQEKSSSVSKISARTSLITEFIEFLENSMPEVIGAIIALTGIVIILASLNFDVFLACIGLLLLVLVTYTISGKFNYRFNAKYNDQLERQVKVIESKDFRVIRNHFQTLMKWNIRLSDLETLNYLVIWIGVIALFIFTPITVIESGVLKYGLVFSILMYVFEYIDKLVAMPLYIQQIIRLQEISKRFAP